MVSQDQILIRVKNLQFSYPIGSTQVNALNGVNLSILHGEKVALLGPNGAGKTTLLLHLNGLLHGEGQIDVMGLSLSKGDKVRLRQVRSRVGLIFQDPDDQLFSNTVAEDVAFGPTHLGLDSQEVAERVESALADVGLAGFDRRAPYHLSGGEKRRVAIATVLSMRPEIIVADEPSSGLDPRARRGLIALMRTLPQTMLVATNDLDLASAVLPRCIVLNDGKVVHEGSTDALLRDSARLESYGL